MDKQETSEVFLDPRAKALLDPKAFQEFPDAKPKLTQTDYSAMRNMAANVVGVNRELMLRFIDQMVADLSKHDYIKAVVDPAPNLPPGAPAVRGIEAASVKLIELINIAHDKKNAVFLAQFETPLFTKLTPLLEGHLLSRIQAAIILASAASPGQVDLFVKQISDPKQVVWVKHWSAVGLTNATNKGQTVLNINQADLGRCGPARLPREGAGDAVACEAPRAAGARLASARVVDGGPGQARHRGLRVLGPQRSRASSSTSGPGPPGALGMLTIPGSQPYNYKLAAYQVGRLATEIGDRIVADYDQRKAKFTKAGQSDYARHLTGLLLYQVYPAVAGEDNVQNSGLLLRDASGSGRGPTVHDRARRSDQEARPGGQRIAHVRRRAGQADARRARRPGRRVQEVPRQESTRPRARRSSSPAARKFSSSPPRWLVSLPGGDGPAAGRAR